jgi:CRP-like cAMP-binding protein
MDIPGISDRIIQYEDGEIIFEEDSVGDEMYIIESGMVEISQRIDGRKTTIAVLGKGDFFGEMAMFTSAPRSATATAIGKTMLMSFSMEEILQRIQTNVQFAITLFQTLVNRLRSTTSTLRTLIARMYEFGDGFTKGIFPEERALKIGEILVEMGYVTRIQLARSLQMQEEIRKLESGQKLLGEIMVESSIITEEQLRGALAEQQMRQRHNE